MFGQSFKVKQTLEGLLLYTCGSWRFYSKITDDQPKDLLGLMSRADDKVNGKGKEAKWRGWRRWTMGHMRPEKNESCRLLSKAGAGRGKLVEQDK